MDQDDDIIAIDSYEIFDSTSQIRPNRKMEDFSSFQINKSLHKSTGNLNTKWNDKLVKLALENGFKIDEILQAFKELNTDTLNESKMIDYLKSNRSNSILNSDADIIEINPRTGEKSNPFDFCTSQQIAQKKEENVVNKTNRSVEIVSRNEQKESSSSKSNNEENDCINLELDSDSIMIIEPSHEETKTDKNVQSCFNSSTQFTNKLPLNQDQNIHEINHFSIRFDNTSRAFKNRKFQRQKSNNFKHRSRSNNERYSNINYRSKSQTNEKNSPENESTNQKDNLRFIIIDGSNVAREHGKESGQASFSCRGIKIAIEYFIKRGHTRIKALVPRFRRGTSDREIPTTNPEILDELETNGYLSYTPSRYVNNRLILPYDDRFILKAALNYNAIVVSNDNYRDLQQENPLWKKHIETCLLQYSFVSDLFLVADDPLGRRGPNLDQFLSLNSRQY